MSVASIRRSDGPGPRGALDLGFALEYSLGHATHAQNLKRALAGETGVRPTYIDLPYENTPVGPWSKLPGVRSNWSLRASLGAYLALQPLARKRRLDAVLFHTQVTSLLSVGLMRLLPSIISLDATPLQLDQLGTAYSHAVGPGPVESFKRWLNVRAFQAARHLVTWSEWAKESLVRDYGIPAEKITVIPPGIDTEAWDFMEVRRSRLTSSAAEALSLHLLFVGGDFERKGGDTLLAALDLLPSGSRVRVSLVTKQGQIAFETAAQVSRRSGIPITVYCGLTPNSGTLHRLFAEADAFIFPTRGDCLPLAVMEALAAGLPVVTTPVGALPEAVRDGENGLIVPPDDPSALASSITYLTEDTEARRRMGERGRALAVENFDAVTNYRRLVTLLKEVAA